MPPHCDTLDGPVVSAAAEALDARDVTIVLPYVPASDELEVVDDFERALRVRGGSREARELADRWFFENVVRIHRAGEGAAYTGLKSAGLDEGPVIPLAERAIETGEPDALILMLVAEVEAEVRRRLARVLELEARANGDVRARREYVGAMLDLQVWAHQLYERMHSASHEHAHDHSLV